MLDIDEVGELVELSGLGGGEFRSEDDVHAPGEEVTMHINDTVPKLKLKGIATLSYMLQELLVLDLTHRHLEQQEARKTTLSGPSLFYYG